MINSMITSGTSLALQLDLHTRWFLRALENVSDTQSNTRMSDHFNTIKWVAGHLLNSRLTSISRIAGIQPDESYKMLFARGSTIDTNNEYPEIDEIISRWQLLSPQLSENILNLAPEVLTAKAAFQAPINDDTIGGALSFLLSHEAFHIGQLSVLRKVAGMPAMSYQ